jgi:N utilization substance protein A
MPIENQSIAQIFENFKIPQKVVLPSVQKILEETFVHLLKNRYGIDDEEIIKKHIEITIDFEKCDYEIWHNREVVADEFFKDNSNSIFSQISLSQARKINKNIAIGEKFTEKMSIGFLGRRNVVAAREILIEKVRDLVYNERYEKYKTFVKEVNTGNILLDWKKQILVLATLL